MKKYICISWNSYWSPSFLQPTQPPAQWIPGGCYPMSKAVGARGWPFTTIYCWD